MRTHPRGRTVCLIAACSVGFGCSRPNPLYGASEDAASGSTDDALASTSAFDAEGADTGSGGGSGAADVDGPGAGDRPGDGDGDAGSSGASLDDPTSGGGTDAGGGDDTSSGEDSGGPELPADARRVFLSSAVYSGDLQGPTGADARCQVLATNASLGGSWLAFLFDPANPPDDYPQAGGPFVRLDGEIVADDWADLTDGSIDSPIDLTEEGDTVAANVWTGLYDVVGALNDNWCLGWTSARGQCDALTLDCGSAGESALTDAHWDGYFIYDCASLHHLYCVEVGPP